MIRRPTGACRSTPLECPTGDGGRGVLECPAGEGGRGVFECPAADGAWMPKRTEVPLASTSCLTQPQTLSQTSDVLKK